MNLDEARTMVETALEQRRKFGKHFTVEDMPPEFLDALVLVHAQPSPKTLETEQELAAVKEQLTLANRQLGAAKSRETKLRKELASMQQET